MPGGLAAALDEGTTTDALTEGTLAGALIDGAGGTPVFGEGPEGLRTPALDAAAMILACSSGVSESMKPGGGPSTSWASVDLRAVRVTKKIFAIARDERTPRP